MYPTLTIIKLLPPLFAHEMAPLERRGYTKRIY